MKILGKKLKYNTVTVRIENLDDLWYLNGIIKPDDLVKSKTERRIKTKDDMQRDKSTRKTITLTIRTGKTEFNPESGTLRILGGIEEGPEDIISIGSHHTFNLRQGDKLRITKERWSPLDLDQLRDAEKASLRPKILVTVLDEGDAVFGLVRESGINYFEHSKNIGGKQYKTGRYEKKKQFYGEIESFISNLVEKENISSIILAGTGFEKNNFHHFLQEKTPELAKFTYVENTGSHGRSGINEVIKKPVMEKINKDINAAKDIWLVDLLLKEIGRDSNLAVYGTGDVEQAINSGAVKMLVVNDDLFQKERWRIEKMLKNVKSMKGTTHIVNHLNEAGKQLSSLGGVGAVLRYQIKT
ncbi:MAG: mRNA surveillance protein pelota [Candidatus Altiarchaeales archaeon ex4484_2]|nr:MAG: mRNA surveillance protein pelota [Candidatus Altiarchaeales archaeon ex4484_2]